MAGTSTSMVAPEEAGFSTKGSNDATSPVVALMNKRLRNLRKKLVRIQGVEASQAEGKSLNKDQQELLSSKASVEVLIDEYEKLQKPLTDALKEETAARAKEVAEAQAAAKKAEEELEAEREKAESAEKAKAKQNEVEEVLKLLYFAQLFDVRSQQESSMLTFMRVRERQACLSYDYNESSLDEEDLDAIAQLGKLLTSRTQNVSHEAALRMCIETARNWLGGQSEPIGGEGITYADLKERLGRILQSDYFTTPPELQTLNSGAEVSADASEAQPTSEVSTGEAQQEVAPPPHFFPSEQPEPTGFPEAPPETTHETGTGTGNVAPEFVPGEQQVFVEQSNPASGGPPVRGGYQPRGGGRGYYGNRNGGDRGGRRGGRGGSRGGGQGGYYDNGYGNGPQGNRGGRGGRGGRGPPPNRPAPAQAPTS